MSQGPRNNGGYRGGNNRRQDNGGQSQQVAVIQPPRMQMPAHVLERYKLDEDGWRALVDAVFPLAKTVGAVVMALAYAERRNVDIFSKAIHIVPTRVGRKEVETVWPGIGLQRITAHRQPDFAGWDECEFGPMVEKHFKGRKRTYDQSGNESGWEDVEATVSFPEWAQMTFYKMLHGVRQPVKGPKVYWLETYAAQSAYVEVPNAMWQKRPIGQLEKCAEAAALRRGWPDVFGDEGTYEEMAGQPIGSVVEGDFTVVNDAAGDNAAAATDKPTPQRSDFTAESGEEANGNVVEEGEIDEGDQDQGPSLGEQAQASLDREQGESTPAGDHVEPQQPREPGPVPDGFETWDAWAESISTKMKCAANLPKLDTICREANDLYEQAPDEVRQRLDDLYAEKKQDHIEASR